MYDADEEGEEEQDVIKEVSDQITEIDLDKAVNDMEDYRTNAEISQKLKEMSGASS
jgi:hypothetical protein